MSFSLLARRAAGTATPSSSLRSITTDSAHRPPLDLYGLTARYANATYIAASKTSTLEKVEDELLAIRATSEKSAEFRSFLENPLISRDVKTKRV